jgi:hypothetical protein
MAALSQEPYSTRMQIAHLEGITQNTLPNGETEPQFNGLHDRAHRTAVMLFKENILSRLLLLPFFLNKILFFYVLDYSKILFEIYYKTHLCLG